MVEKYQDKKLMTFKGGFESGKIGLMTFKEGLESGKLRELNGLKLKSRRDNPRIFLSNKAPEGYRVICGTFDFDEFLLHGILSLISRHLRLWQIGPFLAHKSGRSGLGA